MKPASTLLAALTCMVLLGLHPGSVIAQPAPDKPFPEELKVTMYEHPKLSSAAVIHICTMVTNSKLAEIDNFFLRPAYRGKELPILTRTSCGYKSPIRTAFTPEHIGKYHVWSYIADQYGVGILNASDPVDQLNVLDYLVDLKASLLAENILDAAQKSLLESVSAYIPKVKMMGAVHSKYYLWKRGVRRSQ